MLEKKLIIDFDSTFVKTEGLPELAEITLDGNLKKEEIKQKISDITEQGMAGSISFADSLLERIKLLKAKRRHVEELGLKLKGEVSLSFRKNKDFIYKNSASILIFSGGFIEFIKPVLIEYGIKPENIYANTFVYDDQDNVIGFDEDNNLAKEGGKTKQLEALAIEEEVRVVGDGYTDYEMREAGLASKFYAFVENVERETVTRNADMVVKSFDEVVSDML